MAGEDLNLGLLLATCSGFSAMARDGVLGTVETPLFPSESSVPDFLVLRVRSRLLQRRPVVSTALVEAVDPVGRVVSFRGLRADLAHLPEHVPLAL